VLSAVALDFESVAASPAQALFQVAVVLIPALLLAGGLVRQGTAHATEWYEKAIAALMVLVVIGGQ
jgi:hypothetical protein